MSRDNALSAINEQAQNLFDLEKGNKMASQIISLFAEERMTIGEAKEILKCCECILEVKAVIHC